jgi:hypothetical protein
MSTKKDRDWLPWKFAQHRKGIWKDPPVQKRFMQHLAKSLRFTEMSDWYKLETVTVDSCFIFLDLIESLQRLTLNLMEEGHCWSTLVTLQGSLVSDF